MTDRAFSGNGLKPICVDCKAAGSYLITYVKYQVGDIVCTLHRTVRANALGRRIAQVDLLAYIGKVKLLEVGR